MFTLLFLLTDFLRRCCLKFSVFLCSTKLNFHFFLKLHIMTNFLFIHFLAASVQNPLPSKNGMNSPSHPVSVVLRLMPGDDVTGRLGRSRALNYLKPAGVLTQRRRPITAQLVSPTATQQMFRARRGATTKLRVAATVTAVNETSLECRRGMKAEQVQPEHCTKDKHHQPDVSQTRQSAPGFSQVTLRRRNQLVGSIPQNIIRLNMLFLCH